MSLNKEDLRKVAKALMEASAKRAPIDPITDLYPSITVEEAYEVQLINVEEMKRGGSKIVGKKIGLTSYAMQQMFGVSEPDYGHLFDHMIFYQGEEIPLSSLIQPRVEGEVAFVLERDLKGPGVTPTEVIRATAAVVAALEIIDSRIRQWKIKIQDTVADNASSAGMVLGTCWVPMRGLDLSRVGFVVRRNGRVVATAAGAAVMGDPVQSVAWLANKVGEYGIALEAGEVILSGAAAAAIPVNAGESISLTVDRVGEVGACFS